jgi:O-antigen ligase
MRFARNWIDGIIWCLTTFLFASFYLFETNRIGIYVFIVITGLILFLSAIQNGLKVSFHLSTFHYKVAAFAAFSCISMLWAWQPHYAIEKGITIFEILICMSLIYTHYQKFDSSEQLISCIMWGGYLLAAYTIFHHGLSGVLSIILSGSRLASDFTNTNTIGMLAAVAIVINVYYVVYDRIKWWSVFSIPAMIVIAASGSRKAFLMLVIGIFLIFISKSMDSPNFIYSFLKAIAVVIVSLLLLILVLQLPFLSTINERLMSMFSLVTGVGEVDHSAYIRQQMIYWGIEQFKKTPIVGIGMGNARILCQLFYGHDCYLHNNYAELLANGGLVGFLLYYSLYIKVAVGMWNNKIGNNK